MNTDMMALLIGLLSVIFAFGLIGAAMAGAYFIGKERGRRAALENVARPGGAAAELVARPEKALESLQLEVERIGESQRYSARLLGESAAKSKADPAAARNPTPRTPT
jgi:hypothetical protein